MSNAGITATLERITGDTRRKEIETEQRYRATVARLTGRQEDVVSRYTATPKPGHGPGTYQPRARATGKDQVSLFIPATSFKAGDWQDFQRARDKAIDWLRYNRYQVEDGQKLCWGPSFDLDADPLAYRDGSGTTWINCAITGEQDFLLALIKARA